MKCSAYEFAWHTTLMSRRSYILKLTDSIQLSPSRETASCTDTQELPSILWNQKVHYHVHKSLPLVPILSQNNAVHNTSSYLFKIHPDTNHPLCLGLLSGIFLSSFPTSNFYAFLFPNSCYMLCFSHSSWLDFILNVLGKEQKLLSSFYFIILAQLIY
jgi:hypothetical protein